jgi:hypothetical protein
MLTTEEWTNGPGTPPAVKGLVRYTDGSRLWRGTGTGVYGQFLGRRLSIWLGKYAAVFQAELHAILACAYEICMDVRPEKYVSICCDSEVALIALQVGKTMSPLVKQCQKANDISTQNSVGLLWVPRHSRVHRNEFANKLEKERTVHQFVGREPALQVSRQNMRKKMKCWMDNQHMTMWWCLISTQGQARKLISGSILIAETRLLTFNRTQSRAVTGLVIGLTP